jgi:hypothetical protein
MNPSARIEPLIILDGATLSNVVDVRWAKAVTLYAPSALTGTVTVQISADGEAFYTAKNAHQAPASEDVELAAGEVSIIPSLQARFIRLSSSVAEGDDRTVQVVAC